MQPDRSAPRDDHPTAVQSASSDRPSTRPSRCGPTVPTGTPTPTSTRPRTASSSATPASCGAPRGTSEADARRARRRGRRRRPRGRLRRRPVLPLAARAGAHGRSASTCPSDSCSTPPHRRRARGRRSRSVCADARPRCRSPTTPSTWSSRPSARCSSSPTPTALVAEVARVLRPGGRFAFSVTHPIRWIDPRRPGRGGAGRVAAPTGTARRTSRWTTRPGRRGTSSTTAPSATGSRCSPTPGFALRDLHEPRVARGPRPGLGRVGPLRGRLIPGTAIFVADLG